MTITKSIYFRLLPILGLTLILISYVYFGNKLIRISTDIAQKELELKNIEKTRAQKSLEVQELEKSLENLNKIINQSKNNLLINEATKISNATQTSLNAINTKFVEPAANIIYIQVNDINTKNNLTNIDFIKSLGALGAKVYGYDLEIGRANNTIRYFHTEDYQFVLTTQKYIYDKFHMSLIPQYVKGFENKVELGQVELWIK